MGEYPAHLARERRLPDGRAVIIRPIRPGDERFSADTDYERRMAFVCEAKGDGLVGEARYAPAPSSRRATFTVTVAEGWEGTGLAELLLDALSRAARARGFETLEGRASRDDKTLLGAVRALDFELSATPDDPSALLAVKKL